MTYLAVDDLGFHLFRNKPSRVEETFKLWKDNTEIPSIDISRKLYKILCDVGYISNKNFNYKDEPILIDDISIFL